MPDRVADPFHDHLDICRQCRENPFRLCPTGARLLKQAGEAALKALGRLVPPSR